MEHFLASHRIKISKIIGILLIILAIFSTPILYHSLSYYIMMVLGIICVCIGIIGRIFSSCYMGSNRNKEVVKKGIYSITRNPLYLFSFIGTLGITLIYGSITLIIIINLLYLLYYKQVILFEEKYLSNTFGENYISYLNSGTPRFFPKFSLWNDGKSYSINYKAISQTIKDTLFFVVIAIAIIIWLHIQQNSSLLPVVLKIY